MLPQSRVDSEIVERSVDQRVYLRDVAWEDFERLLAIKGDDPVPRISTDRHRQPHYASFALGCATPQTGKVSISSTR